MPITNAKYTGRSFNIQIENTLGGGAYTTIGGVRAKSFQINNEEVDITDGDDDTWKKLLEGAGVRSISASFSGFITNQAAFSQAFDKSFGGNIWRYRLNFGNSRSITCLFQSNMEATGEHSGAQTFSGSLASADTPVLV